MKISGLDTTAYTPSYTGSSSTLQKIQQKALDLLPNVTCKEGKVTNGIKKAGEKISSAEQRLILGASALMSQPFIDAKNKNVDEKTRKFLSQELLPKSSPEHLQVSLSEKPALKA